MGGGVWLLSCFLHCSFFSLTSSKDIHGWSMSVDRKRALLIMTFPSWRVLLFVSFFFTSSSVSSVSSQLPFLFVFFDVSSHCSHLLFLLLSFYSFSGNYYYHTQANIGYSFIFGR